MCFEQIMGIIQTAGLIFVGAMQVWFARKLYGVSNEQKGIMQKQAEISLMQNSIMTAQTAMNNMANINNQMMSFVDRIIDREDNAKLEFDREMERIQSLLFQGLSNIPISRKDEFDQIITEALNKAKTNYNKRIQSIEEIKEEIRKYIKSL